MNRPVAGLPVNGRSTGPDRSNGRPAGLKCGPGPDRNGRSPVPVPSLVGAAQPCQFTQKSSNHSIFIIKNEKIGTIDMTL